MVFVNAFGVWLVMLVAAFINGAIRELLIVPQGGEQVGHFLSVFVLSGVIFGITYLFIRALGPLPARMLLGVGLFWLVLSLLFEFGFFTTLCMRRGVNCWLTTISSGDDCSALCGSPCCLRRCSVASSWLPKRVGARRGKG